MIRVGVIGAGFIGRNHFNQYEKLADRCRVVALCDKDAERRAGDWSKVGGNLADAQGSKRNLDAIKPCVDWRELIAEAGIDAVDICAPTHLHREISVAALGAGKHVLCEKPMALSVEDCDAMIAAGKAAGRVLMVAQVIRFWPEYVWLKRVFDSGEFGPLRALHLRRQTSAPTYSLGNWIINPDLSGGAIVDLHVHDVDYALHLLGKPKHVYAQSYPRSGGGYDRVHAAWHYRPELVVQVEAFWDLYPGFTFNMGFTAAFEKASVVWDMKGGVPLTLYEPGREPQQPKVPEEDGYLTEIAYFLSCIAEGRAPAVTTPEQSRDAIAIALAEKQSASTGAVVAIR